MIILKITYFFRNTMRSSNINPLSRPLSNDDNNYQIYTLEVENTTNKEEENLCFVEEAIDDEQVEGQCLVD
jgi:hypothetical protein